MKTAMQQLIEYLETRYITCKEGELDDQALTILITIEDANLLIEKEKEQIKDAFKYGWNWNYDAEKYYNETYN